MYRFQRLGGSIGYVFILTLIMTILFTPKVLKSAWWFNGDHLPYLFIPIVIAFYYVLFIGISFIGISLLASMGYIIKILLKKRLNYQQVWIITTNAITIPSLVISIIEVIRPLPPSSMFGYGIACLLILMYMIQRLPKTKKQPTQPISRKKQA